MRNPTPSMSLALLLGLLFSPVVALALPVDLAVERALERDEALKASEKRVAALSESAIADAALPDPELMIGAEGVPVDDPFSSDMMTMYKLGLRQRIPAGQTRSLNQQRTRTRAEIVMAEARSRQLEVARQTRLAWIDWVSATRALALTRDSAAAFQELLEITEARYRAGTGRQRDIDQARLERALLERWIVRRETRLDDAFARLERWTGPLGRAEAPEEDFSEWPAPATVEILERRLTDHPSLIADEKRIETGRINTELAEQAYRPQWMVEAGYAHQRGTDPMTMRRQSDKLFAMVSLSVPLFATNRQDRRLAAARTELEALDHDRGTRLQDMTGQLHRQYRLWQRNQQHLELIETIVLAEAQTTVDSTLSAYRADRASFDELVRARLALLEQQLELIDIRRERDTAAIELDYLTAEQLP